MTFDICFAVYNSAKWIDGCVAAIRNLQYDKKQIGLYFADNASSDSSVQLLEALQASCGAEFAAFEILPMGGNKGFGTASNHAARAGKGDFVFFLNVDTEIMPDALTELEKTITASAEDVGAFEMRQFPYEHPKYYNPITMDVMFASGACFILRRPVFDKTGGFDESFFMYAEDVDLSWHIRALGYKIKYVPSAVVNHYTYAEKDEEKPLQIAGNLAGNLALRYKYAFKSDVKEWKTYYDLVVLRPLYANNQELLDKLADMLANVQKNRRRYRKFYRNIVKKSPSFKPYFADLEYNFMRTGAFYENELPASSPFFSVIVRTYQRPNLLRQTLLSLCNQTYKNFEVVVVEDGVTPISEATVDELRPRLNLTYHAMRSQNGLCITGNKGMQLAKGDFLCFLDDDDYFFAEHLEVMATLISKNPTAKLFAAGAIQAKIDSENLTAEVFEPKEMVNFAHHEEIGPLDIYMDNLYPVQAAVFHRSLPATCGGLDEDMLRGYDDWEMWIRFYNHTKLITTDKATSIYRIPASVHLAEQRAVKMFSNMPELAEKVKPYTVTANGKELLYLRYSPEKVKNITDLYTSKGEWLEVANAVVESRTWRATRFLRVVPHLLLKGAIGLTNAASRLCEYVGPADMDFDSARADKLRHYVVKARTSLSWRLPMFFLRRRKK